MKGLIIKDLYQLKSYTRVFLVVVLFCIIMGFSGQDAVFMTYYPGVLMGMMPITLFAYDEKAKFHTLLATLPVKKRTYVTAKYVLGFLLILLACMATGFVQSVKMIQVGAFVLADFMMVMSLALAVALVSPAIVLPLIFLLGTEKGRFVNIIVVVLAISFINLFIQMGDDFSIILNAEQIVLGIIAAAVLMYTVSWAITAVIFDKKEY